MQDETRKAIVTGFIISGLAAISISLTVYFGAGRDSDMGQRLAVMIGIFAPCFFSLASLFKK